MADDADIANDYIQHAVQRALANIQSSPQGKTGSKICVDCGEQIPDARRKLGFKLCVPCAEESERRKSLFANY